MLLILLVFIICCFAVSMSIEDDSTPSFLVGSMLDIIPVKLLLQLHGLFLMAVALI